MASSTSIKKAKVSDLIPYANNSRTHSDEQVLQIASSIKEFGFLNPIIVDGENGIIAGHGRVMAAKKLGLDDVPCIDASHLSEAQKKAYIIADNKLALNAGWDDEILRIELNILDELDFDLSLTGFSEDELQVLTEIEELAPEYEEGADGEVIEPPAEPKTKEGDIWILGKHRLMCGDSTSIDAVDKLMNGNGVDLLFTDPPYNVAFNGRSGKHDVIMNDDMPENEFEEFIDNVIQTIKTINPPHYYIWCNWDFYGVLQGKLDYKSCIVWAKNVFGMGTGYRHQHEFCLFNGKIDDHIKNESDLWHEKKR